MSELPGMWDESDLRGGEADSAEDRLRAQNAVLKEENERYDGAWYNRDQVEAELQRRLGFGDLESCIQKADSWNQVAALLDELVPDWKCRPDLTRCNEALEAIRGLTARIAELERDLEHINDVLEEREAELYRAAVALEGPADDQ